MTAIRIEADAAGSNLAVAINQDRSQDSLVRFWWLGQAGFALRRHDALLLIDPYLSDSLAEKYRNSEFKHLRMMPPPVTPEELGECTWYLCTHGHTDHMDPGTIRAILQASSPNFLIPRAELDRGRERGIPAGNTWHQRRRNPPVGRRHHRRGDCISPRAVGRRCRGKSQVSRLHDFGRRLASVSLRRLCSLPGTWQRSWQKNRSTWPFCPSTAEMSIASPKAFRAISP